MMNFMRVEKFGKALDKAMLMDMASAALWTKIDIIRLISEVVLLIKPSAIPSNKACMLKAIMRMKGVMLHLLCS